MTPQEAIEKTKRWPETARETEKVMAEEIARLRDALQAVKDHCAGDALPRWDKGMRTTNSRGYIMDVCDVALGNAGK